MTPLDGLIGPAVGRIGLRAVIALKLEAQRLGVEGRAAKLTVDEALFAARDTADAAARDEAIVRAASDACGVDLLDEARRQRIEIIDRLRRAVSAAQAPASTAKH